MPRKLPLAAALLLAALLPACGGDDPTVAAAPDTDTAAASVDVRDFLFEPAQLRISTGATVTFTNRDRFGHTATSRSADEAFDVVLGMTSDADTTGLEGSHTFTEPGTFEYFCRYHPSMTGTVVVG